MPDPMHDDDPKPTCTWCKSDPCVCEEALSCGIENPEYCDTCQ